MAREVHEEHRARAPPVVSCAVITVSDTRTEADDESGAIIAAALTSHGHRVGSRVVVRDDVEAIRAALEKRLGMDDAVIVNGGTGIGRRDLTIEAVNPYLEKEIAGFGETLRRLSFDDIGSPAILSRATAGVRDGRLIVVLPGSPRAVELAMRELVLPELAHMVSEASR